VYVFRSSLTSQLSAAAATGRASASSVVNPSKVFVRITPEVVSVANAG